MMFFPVRIAQIADDTADICVVVRTRLCQLLLLDKRLEK